MKSVMFFIGLIVIILSPLSIVFSMEPSEDLVFEIQDKTLRRFVLRPMREQDNEGIRELETVHESETPEDLQFLTLEDSSEMRGLFSFERKYIYGLTAGQDVIEKSWVIIEKANGKIIGELDCKGEEAVFLIHPSYRKTGVGSSTLSAIYDYLKKKIGQKDVSIIPKEENYSVFEGIFPEIKSYADYINKFLPLCNIHESVFKGYTSTVTPINIGALRICLVARMTVQGVVNGCLKFVSPSSPETEDASLRFLVESLASKIESERQAAFQKFRELYPPQALEDDAAL